jgi:hypothetical protein
MIIVKLQGGLGNQMFQYAAARRLACQHGTKHKLDLAFFENKQYYCMPRIYELDKLHISAKIASKREIAAMKGGSNNLFHIASPVFFKILKKKAVTPMVFTEQGLSFNREVLSLPDNVYLQGYWQSEKYFQDIENIIRKEFAIKLKPDSINMQKSREIIKVNSISVHIRRGDYVANQETHQRHGTCSLEYYKNAVDILAAHSKDPHFFVFSDDPVWAKMNFKTDYPVVFFDHNSADTSFEDMRLMSLCRHNIIANSSFSWWGAWLNNNPDKIIIAPKKWFAREGMNDTDIIPERWVKV